MFSSYSMSVSYCYQIKTVKSTAILTLWFLNAKSRIYQEKYVQKAVNLVNQTDLA